MATPTARRRPDTVSTVTGDVPVDGSADRDARTVTAVDGAVGGTTVVPSTVGGAMLAGAEVAGAWVVGAAVVGAAVVGATVVGATVVGAAVVAGIVVDGAVVVGAGQAGMLTDWPGHDGPAQLDWTGANASTAARPSAVNTFVLVDIRLPRFDSRTWLMPSA